MVKLTRIREPLAFVDAVASVFPFACAAQGHEAVRALLDEVDDTYRHPLEGLYVVGEELFIPDRLHFPHFTASLLDSLPLSARCLVTRSTNGYCAKLL